jgi:hypothetical protein
MFTNTGQLGNIQMHPPGAPANPGVAPPMMSPGAGAPNTAQMQQFQQRMGSLHPDTMAALKSIPQKAMQQLHSAGLVHPGMMDHLYGGGVRGGMGSMSGNKAY